MLWYWLWRRVLGPLFGVHPSKDVRDEEIWFRPPVSCSEEVRHVTAEDLELVREGILTQIRAGDDDKTIMSAIQAAGWSRSFSRWATEVMRAYGKEAVLKRPQDP